MANENKQRVEVQYYDGLQSDTDYCPDDLIEKAEQMKKDSIISIEIEKESGWYNDVYIRVRHYRIETDMERDDRVVKEKASEEHYRQEAIKKERETLRMLKKKYEES